MIKKTCFVVALSIFSISILVAQEKQLYSQEFSSPYSEVTARVEIWGGENDRVESYINTLFYSGDDVELNVLRIYSSGSVTLRWFLSSSDRPSTVGDVYSALSGVSDGFSSSDEVRASFDFVYGPQKMTVEEGTREKSGEVSLGVGGWGHFELSFSVDEMLGFDRQSGNFLATGFGFPLSNKRVLFQVVNASIRSLEMGEPTVMSGELVSRIRLPAGPGGDMSGIRSVNVWEDGVFLAPSAYSVTLVSSLNGSEELQWKLSYSAGKRYQLQVVDILGNSDSVWYPARNESN